MTDDKAPVTGGVLAAVLTPLKPDLGPDHAAFIDHCRWLLNQGCDGLAILGTTGEANAFSVDERLGLLDALAAGGIPPQTVIPGTGCCAIPDTVALTRKAVEMGAAGVLMLPPFYYKPVSDDGLFAAYSEVIQRIGDDRLKIYLYHIPKNTQVPITFGLIEKLLAAYPDTVVGVKDSSGDFSNMEAMCREFPGFRVLSGSDSFLLDLLRAGGAGAITACNNVTAALSAKIYAGWQDQDVGGLQKTLEATRAIISEFPLAAALKEIMARATGRGDWRLIRPPQEALSPAKAIALFDQLDSLGFEMDIAA
ncbi:MAG: dihydrodipicolinate synthase family protein [Alphaproteobacteria bacterium]